MSRMSCLNCDPTPGIWTGEDLPNCATIKHHQSQPGGRAGRTARAAGVQYACSESGESAPAAGSPAEAGRRAAGGPA